jgi:phosphatidylserine/phosphatidylglycerophosphate/cardiolipin synthase-like enzyme
VTHPTDIPRTGRTAVLAWLCILALLEAGCQMPPAHPYAGADGKNDSGRCAVLTRQVIADTAVRTVCDPIHTTTEVACTAATGLWFAGREFLAKRCLFPLLRQPAPLKEDRTCVDADELEHILGKVTHRPLEPALVQLDLDGEDALRRLEHLIDSAQHSIDILMYQWDSDALGWSLAQRLAERAAALGKHGCPPVVRLVVDGGGNLIHGPPECATAQEVNEVLGWLGRQPHVELLRSRNALACFDHRKLVVIDNHTAWTGGRNFTLASFFEYHDVSFQVDGPLVGDLVVCFEEAWKRAGGRPCPAPETRPEAEGCNAWARVVGTGWKRRDYSRVLYRAIDQACHHVYLENPYITDNLLWCKLAKARRRGADVRMVFAEDSQSHLIDCAMRVTANRLLALGVRVYMHPGTTHVKGASVDSCWAYLGTGNFDNLSLHRNREVGLAVGAGPLIEEVEQRLFAPDFRPEWELKAPLPVSFKDYLCEMFANLIL